MRHLIANIATYTIAALLLAGAGCFAWVRSAQLTVTEETTLAEQHRPATEREFDWQELGRRSYLRNCANCHGAGGEGWDQYPGLDHAAGLARAPGGRDYLVDVHLYGLTSHRWGAPMPPMGHIPDVELAACLNHVLVSFGGPSAENAPMYLPSDIARRRGAGLAPREVNERRPSLSAP